MLRTIQMGRFPSCVGLIATVGGLTLAGCGDRQAADREAVAADAVEEYLAQYTEYSLQYHQKGCKQEYIKCEEACGGAADCVRTCLKAYDKCVNKVGPRFSATVQKRVDKLRVCAAECDGRLGCVFRCISKFEDQILAMLPDSPMQGGKGKGNACRRGFEACKKACNGRPECTAKCKKARKACQHGPHGHKKHPDANKCMEKYKKCESLCDKPDTDCVMVCKERYEVCMVGQKPPKDGEKLCHEKARECAKQCVEGDQACHAKCKEILYKCKDTKTKPKHPVDPCLIRFKKCASMCEKTDTDCIIRCKEGYNNDCLGMKMPLEEHCRHKAIECTKECTEDDKTCASKCKDLYYKCKDLKPPEKPVDPCMNEYEKCASACKDTDKDCIVACKEKVYVSCQEKVQECRNSCHMSDKPCDDACMELLGYN